MTVRKSLAQQEEYRVRDTESREPRTEAGRRMLVGLLDYDALPPDRMGWNRDAIRAIEAEAALLARRAPQSPANLDEMAAAAHDAWYAEKRRRLTAVGRETWPSETGEEQLVPWADLSESVREFDRIVVRAILPFLARRAPGDRERTTDEAGLREALWEAADEAHRKSRHDGQLHHCNVERCVSRYVLTELAPRRALAADSRPEEPPE